MQRHLHAVDVRVRRGTVELSLFDPEEPFCTCEAEKTERRGQRVPTVQAGWMGIAHYD